MTTPTTILEDNDVAFLLRSDRQEHIQEGAQAIFAELEGVLAMTSVRKGFAGGGFEGGKSLPKRMAVAAGVQGADLIPDTAELFLGFTSTQRQALGPPRIVNFETLGHVDLRESGYFRGGTHMHLSHLFENVEAWYLDFDFAERVDTTFRPRLAVEPGTQTVAQGPDDVVGAAEVEQDFRRHGAIGTCRLDAAGDAPARGRRGRGRDAVPEGHGDPPASRLQHARQPVLLELAARAGRDGTTSRRRGSTSSSSTRRATTSTAGGSRWTACFPAARELPFEPRARGQGFNSILRTTHRQNFLVPPQAPPLLPAQRAVRLSHVQGSGPRTMTVLRDSALSRKTRGRPRTTPAGRVLSSAVASSSETSTIASPCSAAIRPKRPSSTRSAALRP